MSKIGELNLELQEQAERLGFDSVQQAIDAGMKVNYITRHLEYDEDELELAQLEWEHEKNAKRIDELKERV